jgi:hypothetical protein
MLANCTQPSKVRGTFPEIFGSADVNIWSVADPIVIDPYAYVVIIDNDLYFSARGLGVAHDIR